MNANDSGLIGFFDILGYTNIIENNQIEEVSRIVAEKLLKIPESISEKIHEIGKEQPTKEFLKTFTSRVKWVIFSDIILLALPTKLDKTLEAFDYGFFLIACSSLQRMMFDAGLPTKGAISVGPFYIHERCFAGQPIIDCYKLTQDIDFAGCIIHESVIPQIENALRCETNPESKTKDVIDARLATYLAPLKNGVTKRCCCLSWGFGWDTFDSLKGDIRELVINSFGKHNKDIPPEVYSKIENTEMFLRFIQQKNTLKI